MIKQDAKLRIKKIKTKNPRDASIQQNCTSIHKLEITSILEMLIFFF